MNTLMESFITLVSIFHIRYLEVKSGTNVCLTPGLKCSSQEKLTTEFFQTQYFNTFCKLQHLFCIPCYVQTCRNELWFADKCPSDSDNHLIWMHESWCSMISFFKLELRIWVKIFYVKRLYNKMVSVFSYVPVDIHGRTKYLWSITLGI